MSSKGIPSRRTIRDNHSSYGSLHEMSKNHIKIISNLIQLCKRCFFIWAFVHFYFSVYLFSYENISAIYIMMSS